MIGQTVSHYHIIEKLGEGGMGLVYKARDTKLDRFVALKFLSPSLEASSELSRRFINEAKTASALDHANIGAIYEIDETENGQMFIAMAYYEGETLKQKIAAGQFPISVVLDYATQIARGLAKAHEHGIVHRDLKPANILISRDGVVKIIDFGLAKLQGSGQLTRTGASVGTIAYMSPEQARGEDVDHRTDIASFGSVIYEMLAGKPPYLAEFEAATLYLIVNEEPKPVGTLRNDVPAVLEAVLTKMMQKDPEKRYQQMTDVLTDLVSLEQELRTGGAAGTTRRSSVVQIPTFRVSFKIGKTIYILAALLLIIGGILLYRLLAGKEEFTSADRSVVVMPISNLSDPEQAYLSEGLTREMIRRLSRVPDLITVSSPTSFLYAKTTLTDDSLAARLGVRFMVRGFLRLISTKIFLEIFMYDRIEHQQIWRSEIEGDRKDLLKLEMQALKMILGGLRLEQAVVDARTDYPASEVHEGYLRAMYYMDEYKESSLALAKEVLVEILGKDSTYAPAWVLLSRAYVIGYENHWKATDDDLAQAERAAFRALKCDSMFIGAYVELSRIQLQKGDPSGAIRHLQSALDRAPSDVAALENLAGIYLVEMGDPARGLLYLKKILAYDPTDWLVVMNTGIAYAQLKDYPQALHFFTKALGINPDNPDIWSNLGYVYERTAKYDSAVFCYSESVAKAPPGNTSFVNLSDLLIASEKYAAAESVILLRLKSVRVDADMLYRLGYVYEKMGNTALAREKYREGSIILEDRMRKNSTSGLYRASFGLFQARLGNFIQAVEFGERAMKIDSSEEILMTAAKIYAVTGKKERMLGAFRAAKEKNVEYDVEYLHSAFDFDRYKRDADLLAIARQR